LINPLIISRIVNRWLIAPLLSLKPLTLKISKPNAMRTTILRKTLQTSIAILLGVSVCQGWAQNGQAPYGNNPLAGQYAQINGINLYFETYGKGEPLVMFHGNGGSIEAFKSKYHFSKNTTGLSQSTADYKANPEVRPTRFHTK
jgi:hypothetical protein